MTISLKDQNLWHFSGVFSDVKPLLLILAYLTYTPVYLQGKITQNRKLNIFTGYMHTHEQTF